MIVLVWIVLGNVRITVVFADTAMFIFQVKFLGIDLDWIVPPPKEVLENKPFTASFSLSIAPEFYTWAVQDAQNNFKNNFFRRQDGTLITR